MGQIWPIICFCTNKINVQTTLLYVKIAWTMEKSWVFVKESKRFPKPNYLISDVLQKKYAGFWLRGLTHEIVLPKAT